MQISSLMGLQSTQGHQNSNSLSPFHSSKASSLGSTSRLAFITPQGSPHTKTQQRLPSAQSPSPFREPISNTAFSGASSPLSLVKPNPQFNQLSATSDPNIEPEDAIDKQDKKQPGGDPICNKIKQSLQSLRQQASQQLQESWQPMDLFNKLAENRSQIDRKKDPVIMTSLLVAAMKSAAGVLTNDRITPKLAGKDLMNGMKLLTGTFPKTFNEFGVVSRSPWIDNRIQNVVQNEEIEQLVVLAAGLDTRAYRMPELSNVDVFELDFPSLIESKNRLFSEVQAESDEPIELTAKSLTRLGADLSDPAWQASLAANGFDPEKPTLFLAEGLLYYFEPEQAEVLVQQIHDQAAPGSHLLYDCINEASTEQSPIDKMLGKPPLFKMGIDNPEQWTAKAGFEEVTALQPGEEGANFGLIDDQEADQKGFHRTMLGSLDRFAYKHPRDEPAPDGKPVRRFFFVEAVKQPEGKDKA